MEPHTSSGTAKIISALIIGLIVGFAAGAFWQERRLSNELPSEGVAAGAEEGTAMSEKKASLVQGAAAAASEMRKSDTGATPVAAGSAAILVADQPSGASVTVAQVATPGPVWVAVRELSNEKLGSILGVRKVGAGTTMAIVVELLRPTAAGGSYAVVLHQDIGDAAFNYREDVLIEGVEGRFTAR